MKEIVINEFVKILPELSKNEKPVIINHMFLPGGILDIYFFDESREIIHKHHYQELGSFEEWAKKNDLSVKIVEID